MSDELMKVWRQFVAGDISEEERDRRLAALPPSGDTLDGSSARSVENGSVDAQAGAQRVEHSDRIIYTPVVADAATGDGALDDDDDDDTDETKDDPAAEFQAKLASFNGLVGNQFFDPAGIHIELKPIDQWVLAKNKRPQKIVGGRLVDADGTDPQNWLPFDRAVKLAVEHNCPIGFAFNYDYSPVCGIDIDHCLDEHGRIVDENGKPNHTIADLVASFTGKAYIEVSSGGRGLHIIFFDTDAPTVSTRRFHGIEVYNTKRFFVITGKVFGSVRPASISAVGNTNLVLKRLGEKLDDALKDADACGDLDAFIEKHRRPFEEGDDDDIIRRIRRSKSKDEFVKLFDRGDLSDFNGDHSRADFKLMLMLARFTANNPDLMKLIFDQSKLADRSKWRDRPDYQRRTIAKAIIFNERLRPSEPAFNPFSNKSFIADIRRSLERNITPPFKPVPNASNFGLVFENDLVLANLVAFNSFTQQIVLTRRPYWHGGSMPPDHADTDQTLPFANIPWQDIDDAVVQNYIEREYKFRRSEVYRDFLSEYAFRSQFHPVKDFLNSLPTWDGKPRAERLFIDHLAADDNTYTRAITFHWLLAAVARIFQPGCKFDYCLVLKGKQGIGKSTILSMLGGKWAGELDSIIGKDAVENLQGKWIIELTEMQATKKAENEQIKAFISRQSDSVRLPYERRSKSFPRQCVFAATTNDAEVLRDQTGGRRFLFIECKAVDCNQRLSDDDVIQIWAEVYSRYKALFADGFDSKRLDIPEDIKPVATKLQADNTDGDDLRAQIIAFLARPVPKPLFWQALYPQERRRFFDTDVVFLPIERFPQSQRKDFEKYCKNIEGKGDCLIINRHGLSEDGFDEYFGRCGHDDNHPHQPKRDRISPIEICYELFDGDRSFKDNAFKRKILDILRQLPGWKLQPRAVNDPYYGRQRNSFVRVDE